MDVVATCLVICIASSYLGINALVYGFREYKPRNGYNVLKFGAYGNGQMDDTQAFVKAWEALCQDTGARGIPTLVVPWGKFLLLPVQFLGSCKSPSVHVQLLGTIIAPSSTGAWGSKIPRNTWIAFDNVGGLNIYGQGTLDSQGSIWWTTKSIENRPTALRFHNCPYFQLYGVTSKDSPRNHISIDQCDGGTISNIHIVAPEDSPNTDGIDIAVSSHININASTIGTGDDCIAINHGCYDINITNVVCGPGHGISVGSLGQNGSNDTVEDVHVRGCTFNGTQNGARIKTWEGGSGYVRRISFDQITLIGSQNPIIINQHYPSRSSNQHYPSWSSNRSYSSALHISDVTFTGFQGTSATQQAITLICSEVWGCTNIIMEGINITSSYPEVALNSSCSHVQGKARLVNPLVPCLASN